ncbi:MAG TPA: 6,7-dimethyl-8-ribityllumazine synthase [Nannocystaceae bacterium]|nr:6,7-dimethyl-8-ribityllumazine synthase [Nannocystaceae bacterium]
MDGAAGTPPGAGTRVVEGDLDATGLRFAVVVSRFNGFITERLLDGALDVLLRHGARNEDVTVVRVPGAWEIPQAAARIVERGDVDAIVALGCLMRGDTIHFDLIAGEVAKGLMALGTRGTAVAFGVLTTDGLEQSVHRAGAKLGNKGAEAALAAIEQARLHRILAEAPASTPARTRATARRKSAPRSRRRK